MLEHQISLVMAEMLFLASELFLSPMRESELPFRLLSGFVFIYPYTSIRTTLNKVVCNVPAVINVV